MPITTTVVTTKPSVTKAAVLIIPVDSKRSISGQFPGALQRELRAIIRKNNFEGEWGTAKLTIAPSRAAASFIGFVGLGGRGESVEQKAEAIRRGVGKIVQDAREHAVRDVAILIDGEDAATLAAAAYEGAELATYRFVLYQKQLQEEQRTRAMRRLICIVLKEQAPAARASLAYTKSVLVGVLLTRDLVTQPAAFTTPKTIAEKAREISKQSPQISVRILNKEQAKKEGFTAFLAVAQGSDQEPYVIHLKYVPKKGAQKKVVLVGKGITFDSGGLSIKPADGMKNMKDDMAGAATVLGIFSVLPKLNYNIELHGVIAACENMPSGKAYRPGDVVTAKNGKTIEILNTDAEGRVTLADTLSYAVEQKPDVIVDFATLTGACVVALGETNAGLWSNNELLKEGILKASRTTGEGIVPLPMPPEYMQSIESKVADICNISSMHPYGGAITAAMFLKEFVGTTPWAHIDIAGPAFAEKPLLSYTPTGGTGFGIRTFVEFLKQFNRSSEA